MRLTLRSAHHRARLLLPTAEEDPIATDPTRPPRAAAASALGPSLPTQPDPAHARDLEALRLAEQRLARALQLSQKVLDNVADGLYGLDARGRVEFVNPAACRMTGHAASDQLGRDQHELIHSRRADGSPHPREECPIWRALTTGTTVGSDLEVFWRADGTPVPVELVAAPILTEHGGTSGVVVSFRDLTERLAARAQAEELQRLADERSAARALSDRLQQALLTPPPEPDHLQVAVRYAPASHVAHVGGDWYDAFLQPDGASVLVIGDVSGHDSDAAAAMGQLRGLVRTLAYSSPDTPAATLRRVEHTARGLAVQALATAVLARIEREPDVPGVGTRTLRWSNAGHPAPLLLHPDGSTTVLETEPDLMLGVDPDAPRSDHAVLLPDACTLLLFTDGLVEHRGSTLDDGLERLRSALADLGRAPLEDLCDAVLARMLPGGGEDDVALVAVRTHPEDRPRPPEAGPNRLPPDLDRPADQPDPSDHSV